MHSRAQNALMIDDVFSRVAVPGRCDAEAERVVRGRSYLLYNLQLYGVLTSK